MKGLVALGVWTFLAAASTAAALDLTGGPSETLPGGGSCTVTGTLGRGGVMLTCTIAKPSNFVDVYFGVANDTQNGNTMDTFGLTGFAIFRYAGSTTRSITYTSSTKVAVATSQSTQDVNSRVVVTLASGTGAVIETAGNPANNGNGDIEKLFRITSPTFTVAVELMSNTPTIPVFGDSNTDVFDQIHTVQTIFSETQLHLAFYYNECGT